MPKRRATLIAVLAAVAAGILACCGVCVMMIPIMIQQAREANQREQATESLRQIEQALRNYHQAHPNQEATKQDTEKSAERP